MTTWLEYQFPGLVGNPVIHCIVLTSQRYTLNIKSTMNSELITRRATTVFSPRRFLSNCRLSSVREAALNSLVYCLLQLPTYRPPLALDTCPIWHGSKVVYLPILIQLRCSQGARKQLSLTPLNSTLSKLRIQLPHLIPPAPTSCRRSVAGS